MKSPHPLQKLQHSFRARIFSVLILLILAVSSAFTLFYISHESAAHSSRLVMKGELLAQLLAHNSRLALFSEHPVMVRQSADGIFRYNDVLAVTIFSIDGKVLIDRSRSDTRAGKDWEGYVPALRKVISRMQVDNSTIHFDHDNSIEFLAPVLTSFEEDASPEALYFKEVPATRKNRISGIVRVELDKSELNSRLHQLVLTGALMATTFLVGALLIAFLVARKVTGPLERLMDGVQSLERGELSARIVVETDDELGEVSRAFNMMARTLQQRETENRELGERLRLALKMEAAEEWENTFDTVPDLIAILDAGHRIVRANRAMVERLQRSKEEVAGTRMYEELHAPGPFAGTTVIASLLDSSGGFAGEIFQQHTRQYFMVTITPLRRSDGCGQGSVYVARDVTTAKVAADLLKKSERRFRLIADTIVEAFWIAEVPSSRILYVSPGYQRIWQRSPESLYESHKSFLQTVYPDDRGKVRSGMRQMRTGRPFELEYRIIRPDGSIRWIWDRGYPVADGGEWADCYTGVALDITDQKQAAEERKSIQAKLIQANKMTSLGLMVSGLGHEVNNPNNMIKLAVHLLARSWQDILPVLEEQYRQEGDFSIGGQPFSQARSWIPEHLSAIRTNSLRIEGIIRNLRHYVVNGEASLNMHAEMNTLVSAAATILTPQIKLHTRQFSLNLHHHLLAVRGNSQQLEQVVINLIMNAVQALPSPDRAVVVSTGVEPSSNWVVLTVQDEGCGIPGEIRDRVGEPFFSTKLDCGGTGLGLAISALIIKEHQGLLELESEAGVGTTIRVKLPVAGELAKSTGKGGMHVQTA